MGRVDAFWVWSGSPDTVAAGPGAGGHQALLPCGRSQGIGVSTAARSSTTHYPQKITIEKEFGNIKKT